MNGVRKALSAVKGGRLAAAAYPARVLALMISDVPGDDPADIASGPTVATGSDAAIAMATLRRWGVTPPEAVLRHLAAGTDPIRPGDPRLARVENRLIAKPYRSLDSAAEVARAQGMRVEILSDALEGEARDLGRAQVAMAMERQDAMAPDHRPLVLLSGGECTVTGRGSGSGGPNAEFVLAAAIALDGRAGIHVIAGDTDGVDGAAEIAGAVASPDTLSRAQRLGLDADGALSQHDSHGFFAALGDGVVTGPTLTNVNDFRAILVETAAGD
jgi:hydroxypyruvate reductase